MIELALDRARSAYERSGEHLFRVFERRGVVGREGREEEEGR